MSKLMENQVKLAAEEGNISSKIPVAVCVDDEEFNLEILEKHLKMGGFECHTFTNGNDALDFINQNSKKIDVVLLDIMMPGIDGIEVLKRLKSNNETKNIPVIMQTAMTQEKKNVEGIESGAYYYITKPYAHAVLVSIVKSAIREKLNSENLKSEVGNAYTIIDSIKSANFEIKTFEEARKLANYLARFSADPSKFVIGLTALLINAIEHGNFEIGFEEKAKLLLENRYDEEIENRAKNPVNIDKKVIIELFKKEKEGIYSVVIKDEGKGFNWEEYLDFEPSRMTDPNGRGIAMAHIMNPNSIEYWGRGNVVVFKMPMREKND
ncbi:MAG: response regulator [Rickettsiales bacterium]|nr:response regulator [Rickettsiales bacterium]